MPQFRDAVKGLHLPHIFGNGKVAAQEDSIPSSQSTYKPKRMLGYALVGALAIFAWDQGPAHFERLKDDFSKTQIVRAGKNYHDLENLLAVNSTLNKLFSQDESYLALRATRELAEAVDEAENQFYMQESPVEAEKTLTGEVLRLIKFLEIPPRLSCLQAASAALLAESGKKSIEDVVYYARESLPLIEKEQSEKYSLFRGNLYSAMFADALKSAASAMVAAGSLVLAAYYFRRTS